MQTISNYISVDKEIQFGKPVQSLFWHLEKNISLSSFHKDFRSVRKKQAEAVIEWSARFKPQRHKGTQRMSFFLSAT
ncbi:MAG: hypothetical protein WKG06_46535 [Segetibacter sp.]